MKEKLTTLRLPVEIDREIEKMAYMKDSDKSKILRELIIIGIRERKIQEAIRLYQEGKVTLWKAARLADISLWKMMEIVAKMKIIAQYGERELKEDLKALK
ncbi:MAG: UPF0175 family protein [Nanoarchaeota archaeon]